MVPTHLEKYDLFAALRLWKTTWDGANPESKQWGLFAGRRLTHDGDYAISCRLNWRECDYLYEFNIDKCADTPEKAVWRAIKKFDKERRV